ncbi:hypothetical protein ACNO5E_13505 [Vibrio parahaemolyticus]
MKPLTEKLKLLIVEMREEEEFCRNEANKNPSKAEHFNGYAGGLNQYRTKLEALLETETDTQRQVTITINQ